MALKLEDRLKRLKALGVRDSIIYRNERFQTYSAPGNMTEKGLVHVCYDSGLDFVILASKFQESLLDEHYDKKREGFYYLYDCQYIREHFQDLW